MKLKLVPLPMVVMLSLITACGASETSRLQGHYEEAHASKMAVYRGLQMVPPEYAASNAVIISSELITGYQHEDLAKTIMDTGLPKLWISSSQGSGDSLQAPDFTRLRRVLGTAIDRVTVFEQKDDGPVSIWARDWAPLGALSQGRKLRLLDFNYYPRRPADDATGRSLEGLAHIERVSVPVYNEGGNFMINGRGECLMTTRVTDANNSIFTVGDEVLDADAIEQYYKEFAGCTHLSILPRMPSEGTGHIDMWAKYLDDDTVIVGEVRDNTLALASASQRRFAQKIQVYLNERASDIAELGYRVIRVPMPLPHSGLYRSYTNSLLLNGTAIVPQYVQDEDGAYVDQSLLDTYEEEVRSVYENAGYKTVFVPSDDMIRSGGAVHCVTMQVPAVL